MADVFKMDNEYRNSDEYKEWVKLIQKEAPHLPIGLIEYAIIAHKTDPQAYKKDKNSKKILSEPIKAPKNAGEVVVEDAISIGDVTPEILEQRRQFFERHGISEQAEFIPKSLPAIQEVEA